MKVVTCAVVLGLVAMVANAATMDPRLELQIQPDGSVLWVNVSASYVLFDGYQIMSAQFVPDPASTEEAPLPPLVEGNLLPGSPTWTGLPDPYPEDIPGTWRSIQDWAEVGLPNEAKNALGNGAYGIGEANPTTGQLAELNSASSLMVRVGESFSIGHPFATPENLEDLTFLWHEPTGGEGITWEGAIVPEPTTMAVLGLGLLGFIARKKR